MALSHKAKMFFTKGILEVAKDFCKEHGETDLSAYDTSGEKIYTLEDVCMVLSENIVEVIYNTLDNITYVQK